MTRKKLEKLILGIIFLALLGVGLVIHLDYGNAVDDSIERGSGLIGLRYIDKQLGSPVGIPKGHLPDLMEYVDRDHINLIQYVITGVEILIKTCAGPGTLEQVVLGMQHNLNNALGLSITHLLCFSMFCIGLWCFYRTVLQRWQDFPIALLALLLLGLYPRFFAEAFYNVKDVSLLFLFVAGFYGLCRMVDDPGYKNMTLLAVVGGMAVGCRILGLFVPLVSSFAVFLMILGGHLGSMREWVPKIMLFGVATLLSIYIFWPFLWENPIANLLYSINRMKDFPWGGLNLYRGEFLPASGLPWHYLFVWIVISTPLVYLLMIAVGSLGLLITLLRQFSDLRQFKISGIVIKDISALCFAVLPLVMFLVMRPRLYDGWRHMYFIFPFLLYIGVGAIGFLSQRGKNIRRVICGIIVIQLVFSSYFLVVAHPAQNVYFNFLASEPQFRYELDYWGQTSRQGLAYLVKSQPTGDIFVSMDFAYINNLGFLSPADAARVKVVPIAESNYFMTNFRGVPTDPARVLNSFDPSLMREKKYPYNLPQIYTVMSGDVEVLAIYKVK